MYLQPNLSTFLNSLTGEGKRTTAKMAKNTQTSQQTEEQTDQQTEEQTEEQQETAETSGESSGESSGEQQQERQERPAPKTAAVKIKKRQSFEDVPTVVVAPYTSVLEMYKMMGFITQDTEVMQTLDKYDEHGNRISGKEVFAGKRVIGRVPFYMLTDAHSYVNINIHKGDAKTSIEQASPKSLIQRASIPVEYRITPAEVDYSDYESMHVILHYKWADTFYEFLSSLELFDENHEGKVFVSNRVSTGDIKDCYLYSNNCPFTLIAAARAYVDMNFPGFKLNDAENFTVEDALEFGRIPDAYSVERVRVFPIRHE